MRWRRASASSLRAWTRTWWGGSGLLHSVLGTCDHCSVSTDEVVHGLRQSELADGWQNAEGVAGQQNDVLGVRPHAGDLRIGDEFDRVRSSRVLRHRLVGVVHLAGVLVEHDILHHGAELDGIPNVGLALLRQVDALGVAPSLDVGHPVVGPAVLVVSNQVPVVVGGERGLPRPRQPEEQCDVPLLAHVASGVQRENAPLGHEVVHQTEEPLLHLSRVLRSQDHHLPALQVHVHAGGRAHVVRSPVAWKLAGVVDGEVRGAEVLELLGRGPDAHVVHEQRVVSAGGDNSDLDPVLRVPVQKLVVHEHLLERVEVVDGSLAVDEESLAVHLDVGRSLSPPQIILRALLHDDAFVLGGSAGLGSRQSGQCAGGGDVRSLLGFQSLLVQLGRGQIVENVGKFESRVGDIADSRRGLVRGSALHGLLLRGLASRGVSAHHLRAALASQGGERGTDRLELLSLPVVVGLGGRSCLGGDSRSGRRGSGLLHLPRVELLDVLGLHGGYTVISAHLAVRFPGSIGAGGNSAQAIQAWQAVGNTVGTHDDPLQLSLRTKLQIGAS
ncbi:hypothetical protein Mapa_009530 [Marchantia paleacea]|nr:hypothetical protein Mapa_009530 [Marchantia paleacea]